MKEQKRCWKKVICAGIFLVMSLLALWFVNGLQFSVVTQGNFDQGTYTNTFFNTSGFVQSNISEGFARGNYTSTIFDTGGNATWYNITWTQGAPYQQALPDNQGVEGVLGGADMSGNELLLHAEELSGEFGDSSSLGNNMTNIGAAYGESGKFGFGVSFDGVDDYLSRAYDSDFDFANNSFTIGFWFKISGDTKTITTASRVNVSGDDAEEAVSGGSVDVSSSDLELVMDGGTDQEVGVRFRGVNVPSGAVVRSAYVQFTVDEANSGSTNLTVYGEAHDNAPIFSSSSFNITRRTKTSASVNWTDIPPWTSIGASGADQQTPELSSIIQEVVNRPGWTSGNSLVLIVDGVGQRTAESYDGSTTKAPQLVIEYVKEQYFVSRYDTDQGFKVWAERTGNISFGVDDDSSWNPDVAVTSPRVYNDSNWHHIAAVKENNTNLNLYLDGVLVASNSSLSSLHGNMSSRVNVSGDDAEEAVSGGSVDVSSSDLELVMDGGTDQEVGVRFRGVNVPSGAVVRSAYVQFTVDEANSGSTNLTVYGEAHDNAPIFSSSSFNITRRTKTSASVNWTDIPPWTSIGASGADQQTPDLSSIIQEVINMPGWTSGNSLVLIVDGVGQRTAESYDGSTTQAPLLVVGYDAPLGSLTSDSAQFIVGSDANVSQGLLNGTLDEIVVLNRSLSSSEVLDQYKRGVLALNVSVRSCDDSLCSGEVFVDVTDAPPQNLSVVNNRYFQINIEFITNDLNYSSLLYNFSSEYNVSDSAGPAINVSSPLNSTYNVTSVDVNVSADELVSVWWYSLNNGTNTTFTPNITVTSVEGGNTLIVYANDSSNNLGQSSVNFFVNTSSSGDSNSSGNSGDGGSSGGSGGGSSSGSSSGSNSRGGSSGPGSSSGSSGGSGDSGSSSGAGSSSGTGSSSTSSSSSDSGQGQGGGRITGRAVEDVEEDGSSWWWLLLLVVFGVLVFTLRNYLYRAWEAQVKPRLLLRDRFRVRPQGGGQRVVVKKLVEIHEDVPESIRELVNKKTMVSVRERLEKLQREKPNYRSLHSPLKSAQSSTPQSMVNKNAEEARKNVVAFLEGKLDAPVAQERVSSEEQVDLNRMKPPVRESESVPHRVERVASLRKKRDVLAALKEVYK